MVWEWVFLVTEKETTDGKLIGAKYRMILGGNQLEAEKDLRPRWSFSFQQEDNDSCWKSLKDLHVL